MEKRESYYTFSVPFQRYQTKKNILGSMENRRVVLWELHASWMVEGKEEGM